MRGLLVTKQGNTPQSGQQKPHKLNGFVFSNCKKNMWQPEC